MMIRKAEENMGTPVVAGIFAHPDDESCRAGGTLAGLSETDTKVILICATAGEAISFCDFIAAHDDISRGKPDPEICQLIASELRLPVD